MYREMMIAGILISLLLSELLHLTPAGLVTPALLAMSLHAPIQIIYTVFIALLTFAALKGLEKCVLLYGRRRFGMAILLSFLIDFILDRLGLFPVQPLLAGVLTPGIMSVSFLHQGVLKSLLVLCIALGLLAIVWVLLGRAPLL